MDFVDGFAARPSKVRQAARALNPLIKAVFGSRSLNRLKLWLRIPVVLPQPLRVLSPNGISLRQKGRFCGQSPEK